MSTPSPQESALLAQAAQWLERARHGSEADRAAFRAWLQERPEHVAAMDLVERAREMGALGATISGAGPSVLVWTRSESAAAVASRLESEARGWAAVMRLPFSPDGVSVRTSGT